MPVRAMGAAEDVAVGEVQAHADRARLLARIEMREAGHVAARDRDVQLILELAQQPHQAIGALDVELGG